MWCRTICWYFLHFLIKKLFDFFLKLRNTGKKIVKCKCQFDLNNKSKSLFLIDFERLSSINCCLIELLTLFSPGPIGIQAENSIWRFTKPQNTVSVFNEAKSCGQVTLPYIWWVWLAHAVCSFRGTMRVKTVTRDSMQSHASGIQLSSSLSP